MCDYQMRSVTMHWNTAAASRRTRFQRLHGQ